MVLTTWISRARQKIEHMRNCRNRARQLKVNSGASCTHFAYTWGRHNARVRSAAADAGYLFAAAGHHGEIAVGTDRFSFPRINIDNGWTLDDLRAVLSGDWDYLGWFQRARLAASNILDPLSTRVILNAVSIREGGSLAGLTKAAFPYVGAAP